jgi:hypothetical protein
VSKSRVLFVVLLGAAVAFGIGHWVGRLHQPSLQPPSRSKTPARDIVLVEVAAEVREVLLNPDVLERTADLARLLQRLGPESIEQVRDAYDSVFLDLGEVDLVLLAEWWARHDPEAAFEWTLREWRADHPAVVVMVLRAWGRSDPTAALRRAQQVPKAVLRRPYTDAVIAGWEESGQPGILDYVESLGSGHDRQRAIYTVARRKVLRDGVEAAFRWAEGLPDSEDEFKLNVFRRVASSAAEVDPEAAAAWAERHADGEHGLQLPRRVGTRWAKRDPEAAMRWLSTLPQGWNRDDGVRETYRTWLRLGGDRPLAWLRGAELEPWLDPAVALFATRLSHEDREEALEWAGRISDEELRWGTVGIIARGWLMTDEEAAKAWIDRAELPELYRRKIFEIPEGVRPRAAAPAEAPETPEEPEEPE